MTHPSLLSVVHDVLQEFSFVQATEPTHPLGTTYTSVTTQLATVLNTTHQLNCALNQLNDLSLNENATKLVALMKEHTALTTSINQSATASMSLLSLVRGDNRAIFPDTSPPSPAKIAEWGRSLGTEAFVDGSTTVLAGKVLVLDIDLNDHVAVKTSFANGTNNGGNASAAPELDAFLALEVTRWVYAARCAAGIDSISGDSKEDPAIEAARRSHSIQKHFRYLMMLDGLAAAENEKGLRWFMEPMVVSEHIRKQFIVSPSIQTLDKLLTRSALPLPFLVAPTLSFLVWLSPRAYLQILRSSPSSKQSSLWNIDVPITHLRASLKNIPEDATIATLALVPSTDVSLPKIYSSKVPGDHPLLTAASHMWVLDFTAKSPRNGVVMSQSRMRAIQGIVETHSTMDLNSAMGSVPSIGAMPNLNDINSINFGEFGVQLPVNGGDGGAGNSWIDLLFNQSSSAEYYSAIYKSPGGVHPPLRLRLLAPQEPGFLLQKVPVRSVNQAMAVLALVREQCWLNELLGILQWSPEHESQPYQRLDNDRRMESEVSVSSVLLASVLTGTISPHNIPVNVYLQTSALLPLSQTTDRLTSKHSRLASSNSGAASLFGPGDLEMDMDIPGLSMSMGGNIEMDLGMDLTVPADPIRQPEARSPGTYPPAIVLSSPRPAHESGLNEIRISLGGDGSAAVGSNISVEASAGIDTSYMAEVVRRGGIWGLPGCVWNRMK